MRRDDHGRGGRLLVALGAILTITLAVLAWTRPALGSTLFLTLIGLASAAYLAGVASLARTVVTRRTMTACVLLALAGRAALLTLPDLPRSDVVRYVWDARVQQAGQDPYRARPNDPALDTLHIPLTRGVDGPSYPTIYLPVAQLYFRLVAAVGESVLAFRAATVVCDLLIGAVLAFGLIAIGRSSAWSLVYLWHPLIAFESAVGGHVDFLGVLLLTASWLALVRRRPTLAALALAGSILVKPLAVVLVPIYWRRVGAWDVAAGVALALVTTVIVTGGALPFGSLGTFIDQFRFNGPVFAGLVAVAPPRVVAAGAVLAGLGVASYVRTRMAPADPAGWAWPLAAALVIAPVIYPWYLVWLVPFLTHVATLPLLVWTVSVTAVYGAWQLPTVGGLIPTSPWLLAIEFAPPVLVAIYLVTRRHRHGGAA